MKVLLDACVPRPLRKFLPDHTVHTAQEMGWGQLKNGALLQAVEPQFDAFLTSDQNLKNQQNIAGRKLAILVLPTNDWPTLRRMTDKIAAKVAALKPCDFVEMPLGNGSAEFMPLQRAVFQCAQEENRRPFAVRTVKRREPRNRGRASRRVRL